MPQTSGSGTHGSPGGWPSLTGPGEKGTEKIISLSHTLVKRAPILFSLHCGQSSGRQGRRERGRDPSTQHLHIRLHKAKNLASNQGEKGWSMGTECESENRNARGTIMGPGMALEKEDYYFRGYTKAAQPGSQGGR